MGTADIVRALWLARCVFREANGGFLVFDPRDGRVVDANPAALRMTGYDRPQLIGLRVQDLLSAEADGIDRLVDALQRTPVFPPREGLPPAGRGGSTVPVNVSVSRIHTRPE